MTPQVVSYNLNVFFEEAGIAATIYEIARQAGVSPSTVARALRGEGYCGKEKREKIMEVARRVTMCLAHAAITLKSKKTTKFFSASRYLYPV